MLAYRLEEYENIAPLTNPVPGITGGTTNASSNSGAGGGSVTGTSLASSPATSSSLLKKIDSIEGNSGIESQYLIL